jgi:predicted DCC family thiol-disulfide oxidoreductase YuxK
VQFVIRHDKKKQFLFASLQSPLGKEAKTLLPGSLSGADSIILLYNGKYTAKSTAALTILRLMGGGWQLAYAAIIIPAFIRNGIYGIIARNRHKWFGNQQECMVPTPELKKRFLS